MESILQLNNIKKSYGQHHVLHNFSLQAAVGEMLAITGRSGTGKTTLLNIIGGLDFDYSGSYLFKGKQIPKSARHIRCFRAKEIAYLFQNFALLEDVSVERNLRIVTNDRKAMQQALQRVGLDGFSQKKIYTLSGGEQQRVALARALIKESSLLIADEPTGSLDRDNGEQVMEILRQLASQGKTVIVVTHNTDILSYFDRVIALN